MKQAWGPRMKAFINLDSPEFCKDSQRGLNGFKYKNVLVCVNSSWNECLILAVLPFKVEGVENGPSSQ